MLRRWLSLAGDVVFTFRTIQKAPGFFLIAILAILLGVSSTTTVFSLLSAVLIHPLPYGDPARLIYVWSPLHGVSGIDNEIAPFHTDVIAMQNVNRSFASITAVQRYVAYIRGTHPFRVGAARVLGNFFQTMGAHAEVGRVLTPSDDQPGDQFVAVISDGLWRSRFGGDPNVVGKTMRIDRNTYRLVGVVQKEFSYPQSSDYPGQYQFGRLGPTGVWTPAAVTPRELATPDFNFDAVVGRLRPSSTIAEAQSELSILQSRLASQHLERLRRSGILLVPLLESTFGPAQPLLRLLISAVSLVLLLTCANLAGLLMARGVDRMHELGIRSALGAERARLMRLLLTESILVSIVGGLLAIPLTYVAVKLVSKVNPGNIPRFEEVTVNPTVLFFGLLVCVATGLVAGIFPAMFASSVAANDLLRRGGRGIVGVSIKARHVVVIAEVAVSVVLLAASGLLLRSYLAVQGETKGFSESTLTMSIQLDPATANSELIARTLMSRIQMLPGVQVAGSIDDLPLSAFEDKGFLDIEGQQSKVNETASVRSLGGEYFRAMKIPLLAGRYLNDDDISHDSEWWPQNVVVSLGFAKRYFRVGSPVGGRLRINSLRWATLVGVVGDVRHSNLEAAPEPIVYVQTGVADTVVVLTSESPGTFVSSMQRVVSSTAPGAVVADVRTMKDYVDQASAVRLFQISMIGAFSGISVLLTLVGLFGLLSFRVKQRITEIGVRMTLGASRISVLRMLLVDSLRISCTGLGIGLLAASALSRLMQSYLYGVSALDPLTLALVSGLVLVVATVACLTPAWRAANVDPLQALRSQ